MQMSAITDLLIPYDIDGLTKIRLGRDNDGGYVVADELIGHIDHIVSSEWGGDISFEYDLMLLNGRCDMVNYDEHAKRRMSDRRMSFKSTRIDGNNSVQSVIAGLKNVMLKLDIEGAEYDAFRVPVGRIPDLSGVSMLAIELHDIMRRNHTKAIGFLSLISKQMTLFHVHANEYGGYTKADGHDVPNVVELTFVNNALVPGKRKSKSMYPVVGLDVCNKPGATDRPLTFISRPEE